MKRRDILKNLAISSGAVLTLPAWANAWSSSNISSPNFFNKTQASLVSSIAGTFIPEGKTEPGAIGLEVDKFLERLFADCYDLEQQGKIKKGINSLNESSRKTYGKSFEECTQDQRESLLIGFSSPSNEDRQWFYDTLRRETIRGYTTSEYVMVNHYGYVMAPGFYNGCVDVAES